MFTGRRLVLLVIIASVPALCGCGSGGGGGTISTVSTGSTGSTGGGSTIRTSPQGGATFTLTWGTRSAGSEIPAAANSVVISISDSTGTVASQTAARPTAGGTSTVSFTGLPVGSLTVTTTAYPLSNGTGTPLATGTSSVNIVSGTVSSVTPAVVSTITSITTNYSLPTTPINTTNTVTASAVDNNNQAVTLSASELTWVSSNTSVISVTPSTSSPSCVLTGVGPGTATVTVTDSLSGVKASFQVICSQITITPTSLAVSVNGTQNFTATVSGPTNQTVTYSVVDTSGNPTTSGGQISSTGAYTAPSAPGSFQIKAVSNADPALVIYSPVTVQAGSGNITIN